MRQILSSVAAWAGRCTRASLWVVACLAWASVTAAQDPATLQSSVLPTSVDLRPELARLGLTPRAQGARPTCSVFTVVSALELSLARATGRGERLSPEFANLAKNRVRHAAHDGGFFHDILAGLAAHGICGEVSFPYRAGFDPEAAAAIPAEALRTEAERQAVVLAEHLRVVWIKPWSAEVGGLAEGAFDRVRRTLARGIAVAAGSHHSRLLVGYRDDPDQPGGGAFITLDSALSAYAEVTYEFARSQVFDAFYFDVLETAHEPRVLKWAATWTEAAERARLQKRPILASFWLYPGFALDNALETSVFMDDDIVALADERFVPWRYARGQGAPFENQAAWGMGHFAFGSGLLVVSPEGEVIGQTPALHPDVVDAWVRDFLARRREIDPMPPPASAPAPERAARLFARGDLAGAAALISADKSVEGLRLQAAIARRQRRGHEALAKLAEAEATAGATAVPGLLLDKARVFMKLGDDVSARAALDRLFAECPQAAEVPAALVALGTLAYRGAGLAAAREPWTKVVRDHATTPWAAEAAAALASPALAVGAKIHTEWPDASAIAAYRDVIDAPLAPADVSRASAAAVDFLIREQEPDGSWPAPRDRAVDDDPLSNAGVALAALALLGESRDDAHAAVRRALDFLQKARETSKKEPALPQYMDYEVWSVAAHLWLLAESAISGLTEAESARALGAALVDELRQKAAAAGGWSYYRTADLERPAAPRTAFSFVTAFDILALERARDAGIAVPTELLKRARTALASMRQKGGGFAYAVGAASAEDGNPESAGRGPLCELALGHRDAADFDRLRVALARFARHAGPFAAQRGKIVMHGGPDGQGCHYLLFDYFFAARAAACLPAAERASNAAILLPLILATRSAEGSFRDTPILGWTCGTALALMALQALD